ncbi:MAG: IS1595 family transposase [Parvibaculum sp.]|uniref:IS1595 family transposase n=1 Tax=Parvibaculum sp. TaxID=2024848 RepID=UPI0025D0E6DA|nr:IS1595 family transposase [Parvibaculum sp.]MCE9649892.1 IS1595 family transposase [Parvibaculum sp.]
MSLDLTAPIFQDADKAREFLEANRWPNGAFCPHCGEAENVTAVQAKAKEAKAKTRKGLYQCNSCRQQFSVTVGTVFERSHVPLNKWLLATFLLTSSKKGMSAHQLMRTLGLGSYRTAWFMAHRIREAMIEGETGPLGSGGGTVEADETYFGSKEHKSTVRHDGKPYNKRGARGVANKRAVVSLVERGGKVRSFHVKSADAETVRAIVRENVANDAHLRTDESALYNSFKGRFASHETVRHSSKQYVRPGNIHTNTIEGYFSIFKRGMTGIYQHCGEQHLQRYLTEFDFRYSHRSVSDTERTALALKGIEGKRLTYRRVNRQGAEANA